MKAFEKWLNENYKWRIGWEHYDGEACSRLAWKAALEWAVSTILAVPVSGHDNADDRSKMVGELKTELTQPEDILPESRNDEDWACDGCTVSRDDCPNKHWTHTSQQKT